MGKASSNVPDEVEEGTARAKATPSEAATFTVEFFGKEGSLEDVWEAEIRVWHEK